MNRIRAAWSTIIASPRRIAAVAGIAIGAVVVGVGFSLAVNAIRDVEPVGQPASAVARATVPTSEAPETASPIATVTPTVTPSASPTDSATPTLTATPAPTPTDSAIPVPTPTAVVGDGCDVVTVDNSGTLYVNGDEVPPDPWEDEYGEQMPTAVLRLAARASSAPAAEVCLEVELPRVTVTGEIEICGDVVADRQSPMETPPPPQPAPTMPPTYGLPTIEGVVVSDRMLDINSYPLLDIADVEDVPACLLVQADANDVHVTLSLTICAAAQLDEEGVLTIVDGDMEWSFEPEHLIDDDGALSVGTAAVEAGLQIQNHKDDVIHLIEMSVWVTSECLDPGR